MKRGRTRPWRRDAEADLILKTLADGCVLRFTGTVFEILGRPPKTGPAFPPGAVLRLYRAGKVLLKSGPGEVLNEVDVYEAPKRSEFALSER